MNNLRKFNTENEYQAATLMRPSVSWVVSSDTVHFDNVIPVPTCMPTNPDVWVVAKPTSPENFDFSQKIYAINLDIASDVQEDYLHAYLYNSPNDSNWVYMVSALYNRGEEGEGGNYDLIIEDSSMQAVYQSLENEIAEFDLCDILGSGFYLKADDVPSVEVCDQEECTEYECLNWDEETGECIEQGDACISTECTASHTEYPSVLV